MAVYPDVYWKSFQMCAFAETARGSMRIEVKIHAAAPESRANRLSKPQRA
jgi:hypothetical protein